MSIKRLGLSVFIVLCMMFLTCMVGFASDTGSVKGKLHKNSASGSALSGAKVTCGGESDKTDDDGKFKIKGIKKGEHTIKFSKDGYESYQTTVKIKAGETANVGDRWLTKELSSQTSTTTAKCPSGNGLYCGDSGMGQNTGYLYQCTNGSYSLKTSCSNGCQKNATGKDDSCKAATTTTQSTATTGRVLGAMTDTVKPVVNSFNLNKTSMTVNDTVTISYTVSDSTGLKQVELWRSTNNKDWAEITNKRQYLSGRTQASGFFTDNPSSGTYYYGIHVVDTAGNWDSENGPKKLTVGFVSGNASDTIKPTLLSFDVNINAAGDTITISYKVKDSGGSGLKQVELWRGTTKDNLGHVQTQSASGAYKEGQFTEKTSDGIYYYGIHVLDNNNNLAYDNGAKTIRYIIVTIDGMNPNSSSKSPIDSLPKYLSSYYLYEKIIKLGKKTDIEKDEGRIWAFQWNGDFKSTDFYVNKLYDNLKFLNSLKRPVVILSHSWGTVLSYIVLTKYKDIHVDKLITLGSPLDFTRISNPVCELFDLAVFPTTKGTLLKSGLNLVITKPINLNVWHNYYTDCDCIGGKILSIQDNYENKKSYDGSLKCHSSYFDDDDKYKIILHDAMSNE